MRYFAFVALILGLAAPFRGGAFIVRHRLWGYLAGPVLLNLTLALAAAGLAYGLVDRWLPAPGSGWASLGKLTLAAVLVVPIFLVAYPVVSAPFIDLLTEKVEAIVRGGHPAVGFWAGALQAVAHGAAKSLLYLLAIVAATGLSWLTGVGAVLGVALGALFLAYDGFDYPLARRRVGFVGKWRYLFRHPALTLGYSASASAVFLVPLAFVVAPPLSAVGATLAYLDTPDPLETSHGHPRPLPR